MERLFRSGAIQVLVASKDTAWSIPMASYMVIVMGVQFYENKEHQHPVMDVLQRMGRPCPPTEDDRNRCVLMYQQTRTDFYKQSLAEGLPIELHLPVHLLHDYFLADVAVRILENKQDAMVCFRPSPYESSR